MTISIASRFDQLEELPTIPASLTRVLKEIDKESSTADSLEMVIRDDPVFTAKILKMANSSFYGLSGKVNSIARAVMVLGFKEVRNLVVALSLSDTFSDDLGIERFDAHQVWIHSVFTGRAAQMLASHIPSLDSDEMFTAGVIHDLGRVLMCTHFTNEMKEILSMQEQEKVPLYVAEKRYGLFHGDVGEYVTVLWGFSDMLATVVQCHHDPQKAGPHEVAASVVFLADGITKKLGLHWNVGEVEDKLLLPKCLGLDAEQVKKIATPINLPPLRPSSRTFPNIFN